MSESEIFNLIKGAKSLSRKAKKLKRAESSILYKAKEAKILKAIEYNPKKWKIINRTGAHDSPIVSIEYDNLSWTRTHLPERAVSSFKLKKHVDFTEELGFKSLIGLGFKKKSVI